MNNVERRRIRHGAATVSWGPQPYGKDQLIGNCPVDHLDDLITAVNLAIYEIHNKQEVDSE